MSRHYMYILLTAETDNECRRENESRDDAEFYKLRVHCAFDIQLNRCTIRDVFAHFNRVRFGRFQDENK